MSSMHGTNRGPERSPQEPLQEEFDSFQLGYLLEKGFERGGIDCLQNTPQDERELLAYKLAGKIPEINKEIRERVSSDMESFPNLIFRAAAWPFSCYQRTIEVKSEYRSCFADAMDRMLELGLVRLMESSIPAGYVPLATRVATITKAGRQALNESRSNQ